MPAATHSQHLDGFSCTDVPKSQTLTPLKSQKTEGCETASVPHKGLWVIDWLARQEYKVWGVMAP